MQGFDRFLRPGGHFDRYSSPQVSKGTISPPRRRDAEGDLPADKRPSRFNGDLKGFNKLKSTK